MSQTALHSVVMNKATAMLWAEALRSGEYKQTQGALRRDDCFCCLGVVCDILNPAGWKYKQVSEYQRECWLHLEVSGVPAMEMGHLILEYTSDSDYNRLESYLLGFAKMNDSFGWSFEMIADWVEKGPTEGEMEVLYWLAANMSRVIGVRAAIWEVQPI